MSATAAEIQALTQQVRLLTEGMKSLIGTQSQVARSTVSYSDTVKAANAGLEDFEADIQKQGAISKEQARVQRYLLEAKRDEIRLLKQIEQEKARLAKLERDYMTQVITATEYLERSKADKSNLANSQSQLSTTRAEISSQTSALQSFGVALGSAGKVLNIVTGVLGAIIGAFSAYNTTFKESTLAAGGDIENAGGTFDQGMNKAMLTLTSKTGIATKDFLALNAANRGVINSLGGMDNTIQTGRSNIFKMYGLYGSLEESWKQNLRVMTNFAEEGVRPSTKLMDKYNADLSSLHIMTGLTGDAMNTMIAGIAGDSDSISILRAVRAGEREAILDNQRALLLSSRALGMTTTQAEAAAKMLNKMVAAKPLERFKQAAKLRMMGAAMGVETEGAARELMKAPGQQNMALMRDEISNLATAFGAAAGQDNKMMFASIVSEKGGFDELQNTFDLNLAATNKAAAGTIEAYKDSSNSTMMRINIIKDIASNIFTAMTTGGGILAAILLEIQNLGVVDVATAITTLGTVIIDNFLDFVQLLTKGLSYIPGLGAIFEGMTERLGQKRTELWQEQKDKNDARAEKKSNSVGDIVAASQKKAESILTSIEKVNTPIETKQAAETSIARNLLPGETTTVKLSPDPVKESNQQNTANKAEELMNNQLDNSTQQLNKIDIQLKQMSTSNEYLKIIADTNPKLVDLAEKQLAVSTMTQEQKSKAGIKMMAHSAKFTADYSYAL